MKKDIVMVELGRTEEAGKELAMASTSCSNKSPLPMKETSPNYIPYPPPLAKYENVVASPALFRATLEKLHASMGTKFMIPTIGGRELDLHRLFVEVTSRGGIEKIIRERRWKEVTAVFNFPSTATNASFVLRKYYGSLLQHYEQIYFFQARGWTPLPADSVHSTSLPLVKTQVPDPMLPAPEVPSASFHEPRTNSTDLPGAKHASSTGSPVFGVIDGKFDSGYLVTVTIGTETLKGVLYQTQHATEHLVPQHNVYGHNNEYATATPGVHRRRRRKKSEIKRRDPNHPKPNRSGYNFFFAEQHARLKPLHPGKDREISRMIGELWNKLKDSERTTYQEKAIKDKERYRIEMEDYRERLKSGQIMSEAVPIQQRFPDPDVNMMEAEGKLGEADDNESSSCKSGYEYDKNMDKDSDMEPSLEGVANESANVCMEGLCKEDASEMQNKAEDRGDERMENEKEKNSGDAGMEEKKEEAHDETLGYSAAIM